LTTHATKYHPTADRIVQLGEGGVIVFQGNFETFKTTLPLDESVFDASVKDDNQREIWADNGESDRGGR
jgi:type V secretory pathway adhesin AidA